MRRAATRDWIRLDNFYSTSEINIKNALKLLFTRYFALCSVSFLKPILDRAVEDLNWQSTKIGWP